MLFFPYTLITVIFFLTNVNFFSIYINHNFFKHQFMKVFDRPFLSILFNTMTWRYSLVHSTLSNSSSMPIVLFNNYYPIAHSNNSNQFSWITSSSPILTPLLTVVGSNGFSKPLCPNLLLITVLSSNFSWNYSLCNSYYTTLTKVINILFPPFLFFNCLLHVQFTFCSNISLMFSSRTRTSRYHHHEIRVCYRLPSFFHDTHLYVRDVLHSFRWTHTIIYVS